MKITVSAGALASASVLAAKLSDNPYCKKIAALAAVHLRAADAALAVTANILDFALALTVPADVELSGELALSAGALAALTATFPAETNVTIAGDGTSARVACGSSRYKLATVSITDLPPVSAIGEETGRVELAREEAQALFARVSFASATEKARFYLMGVLLHDTDAGLTAVATDAHWLARYTIAGAGGLSSDHQLIVPERAVKIITKILHDKSIERVALSRSKTLFAVEAANARFVTKLIDSDYPAYERIVPAASGNSISVNRVELMRVLERIAAVADAHKQRRVADLRWAGEALHLCHADSDAVTDVISAESTGTGQVAAQTDLLLGVLDTLTGERFCLDNHDGKGPILITDPDDREFLALVMPVLSRAIARAA
jgi:DNA polymerase-3 subunit beta